MTAPSEPVRPADEETVQARRWRPSDAATEPTTQQVASAILGRIATSAAAAAQDLYAPALAEREQVWSEYQDVKDERDDLLHEVLVLWAQVRRVEALVRELERPSLPGMTDRDYANEVQAALAGPDGKGEQ